MSQIQKLPNSFSKNGLPYQLIERNDKVALYSVGGTYYPDDKHYEVIRIIHVPEKVVFGKNYPKREALPSNEQFGREGSRCITDRDQAEAYFMELTEKLNNKSRNSQDNSIEKNSYGEGVESTQSLK